MLPQRNSQSDKVVSRREKGKKVLTLSVSTFSVAGHNFISDTGWLMACTLKTLIPPVKRAIGSITYGSGLYLTTYIYSKGQVFL